MKNARIVSVRHLSGPEYFDLNSLRLVWPILKKGEVSRALGDDRAWQNGVIVFADGEEVPFRTDRRESIVIENISYFVDQGK